MTETQALNQADILIDLAKADKEDAALMWNQHEQELQLITAREHAEYFGWDYWD